MAGPPRRFKEETARDESGHKSRQIQKHSADARAEEKDCAAHDFYQHLNMEKSQTQSKKRKLMGIVTSDKMQKTRVVSIFSEKKHPKYQRYYKVTSKFKAHDENNEYKSGDMVVIEESRPLSKEKRWRITGKINGSGAETAST